MNTEFWLEDEWMRGFGIMVFGWILGLTVASLALIFWGDALYALIG